VKARVTVRTHLDRFVGGATEETIIARVGEGIVTAIGSADSYKDVLENPDTISKTVLNKGLDASTAFGIMSIDIADVDVGDNIGARLQTEQAEANKQNAQAVAEPSRRIFCRLADHCDYRRGRQAVEQVRRDAIRRGGNSADSTAGSPCRSTAIRSSLIPGATHAATGNHRAS